MTINTAEINTQELLWMTVSDLRGILIKNELVTGYEELWAMTKIQLCNAIVEHKQKIASEANYV